MVAVLGLVSVFGLVLARAQDDARVAIRDRFQTRLDLTTRFTTAYNDDVVEREASVAARRLGGSAPTDDEFENVMKDFGFATGVLLDSSGRVLQSYPPDPSLLNADLAASHAYLARAVDGTPSVSNVVLTGIDQIPVVAYAVPFQTQFGRRVVSGAFDISTTPLSDHIKGALPYEGGEVYLVDAAGALVASNVPLARFLRTFDAADHGLAAASALSTSGRYLRDGVWRWFTTSPVSGSSLVMVASAPESVMYYAVEGTSEWLPWIVIVALGLGSIYTVRVLFALHRSREDYVLLARVDPLTGVSNRRALSANADRVLSEARSSRGSVAVLDDRPRSVQVDQRLAGSRGRRRGPAGRHGQDQERAPGRRPARPLGRRGIRGRPARSVAAAGARDRRPGPGVRLRLPHRGHGGRATDRHGQRRLCGDDR